MSLAMILVSTFLVNSAAKEFDGMSGDSAGYGLVIAETIGVLILSFIWLLKLYKINKYKYKKFSFKEKIMVLVFGGAYNGKLDFVKETFNINKDDIFYCGEDEIDFSKKVICGLHKFTYNNILKDTNSLEYIKENINLFKDKIIISDEISSGIVPLKKEDRMWREETGRCLQYLSKESSCVYRIFCGIPTIIKG